MPETGQGSGLRALDKVIAWLLIAFGAAHLSFTRKFDPQVGINAIWFASGGLFMITIGVLNLLRVAYGALAGGVRAVSVGANFVLLLFLLFIATRVPVRGNPQVPLGLALAVLVTAFSILRRHRNSQAQTASAGK